MSNIEIDETFSKALDRVCDFALRHAGLKALKEINILSGFFQHAKQQNEKSKKELDKVNENTSSS